MSGRKTGDLADAGDALEALVTPPQPRAPTCTTSSEIDWELLSQCADAYDNEEADVLGELPSRTLICPGRLTEAPPSHIVLLIDLSRSMGSKDVADQSGCMISRADAAERCTAGFVGNRMRLQPLDVFSVAVFSDSAEILCEALDGSALLGKCAFPAWSSRGHGGTSYKAALAAATRLLELRQDLPRHVLLLSDGRPADSKAALSLFDSEFLRGAHVGVRLHGIGFGDFVHSFAPLQQLVCLTGGTFLLSGCSFKGLCGAFSSFSSTITAISTLTAGSSARARAPRRTPRLVEFEPSEFSDFGRKGVFRFSATRTSISYDGEAVFTQHEDATEVARRSKPYMRGGMRLVYCFQDAQVPARMVAKSSRFLDEALNTREVVESYIKSTAVAHYYANRFNTRLSETRRGRCVHPKIRFVPCYTYEAVGKVGMAGEPAFFAAEPFLLGAFLKFNSNAGFVGDDAMRHHEVVQALTHFTFVVSGGVLLVADLQGVAGDSEVVLTDPQVLTVAPSAEYGPGNLGAAGVRRCLAAHRCGPTCRQLGLDPVNYSTLQGLGGVGGGHRTRRNGGGPYTGESSGLSSGWDQLSEATAAFDFQHEGQHELFEFALSDGPESRASSVSSWVHLLES